MHARVLLSLTLMIFGVLSPDDSSASQKENKNVIQISDGSSFRTRRLATNDATGICRSSEAHKSRMH